LLGNPDRARRLIEESIVLAEKLDDRFSLAYALCYVGAVVSEACAADTDTLVERGLEIATGDGYKLWEVYGGVQRANLCFKKLGSDSALAELSDSIDAILNMGVYLNTPYFMTLLARAYQRAGRNAHGLQALDDAQKSIGARGENWWEAEIHRLRGEILLSRSPDDANDAKACFHQALEISRKQEARSLELRAATSLARLTQRQGNHDDARRVLGDCYARFTEGFETGDLRDAKELLDAMK
jgi:adenylate cyclase